MKKALQTLIAALVLGLVSGTFAAAAGTDAGHRLDLNRSAGNSTVDTPLEVLEQVASLFDTHNGLALNDTTALMLLCDLGTAEEGEEHVPEFAGNLGIGLKIRF